MEQSSVNNTSAPIQIKPITRALQAQVHLPGSKSLTNRALLIAALANGKTTVTNALFSDDSTYFAQALEKLGFGITTDQSSSSYTIYGLGGQIPAKKAGLFVGNAGTAARFLTALLCLAQGEFRLDGDARMRQRPVRDLIESLNQLGANVSSPTGCLPVRVKASGLPGGKASISGEVSSQFLSGLLMVAPYAKAPVKLVVKGRLNSKPYIDMTLAVMADFGIEVARKGYENFEVHSACYQARKTYEVEPDISAASYFFAAPAILGGSVKVENVSRKSNQGDIAFLDILQEMGCIVNEGTDYIEVIGPGELRGVDVDMRDISDTAQTLAVVAPFANSPTTIRGIGFIRAKETDRIASTCNELRRLGVEVQEHADGLTIHPAEKLQPASIHTYNDHRMAMAFALIGLRESGITIENPACVSKTFPNYFEVLETLR